MGGSTQWWAQPIQHPAVLLAQPAWHQLTQIVLLFALVFLVLFVVLIGAWVLAGSSSFVVGLVVGLGGVGAAVVVGFVVWIFKGLYARKRENIKNLYI